MRRLIPTILLALSLPTPSWAKSTMSNIKITAEQKAEAMAITKSLPLRQRVTQLIMPVVKMFDMDSARILVDKYVGENQVGGIMFYKGECTQQIELYNRASSKSQIPLLVAIDGEWGLNMRLRNTPRFPVNMALGAVQDTRLLKDYGEEVGRQCRRMGISINFAPCLDVNSNPQNPVIGRRAYSDDKEIVASHGIAYSLGLENSGVISCAKHFPGHGDTNQDSHKTLPTVARSLSEINDTDLYPFRHYIAAGLNGIMVAHLNVPALDNKSHLSSSLSPVIVNDLLRQKLNFNGLVFTDALEMKGVAKYSKVAVKALLAGNDVLVMPIDFDKCVDEILQAVAEGELTEELINEHCAKIIAYKKALALNNEPINGKNILNDLSSKKCKKLIAKLAQKSITLIRDSNGLASNIVPKNSQLISLGDDENLKMQSLGDTIVTTREFYRYTDKNYKKIISYNKQATELPEINYSLPTVVEVFSAKQKYIDALHIITSHKNVLVIFYVNPYEMLKFKDAISSDNAIVCAYEDTYEAQQASQNAIQGKAKYEGIMPVKIDF